MSAPGRWLRLDVTTFDSEWLAPLSPESQHAWTRLLLYVKSVGTDGRAKRMGPAAAEANWRITALRFAEMENAAIRDGALKVEEGWWVVTGWTRYQKPDRTNSLRQKKFREKTITALPGVTPRYAGVTRHATETLTLTETEEPTSTPLSGGVRERRKKPRQKPEYTLDFLRLWKCHSRGSKSEAFRAYQEALSAGATTDQILSGLECYVREKIRPDFSGAHLFRWLQDERWEEYAEGSGHTNGNGNHHAPRALIPGSAGSVLR